MTHENYENPEELFLLSEELLELLERPIRICSTLFESMTHGDSAKYSPHIKLPTFSSSKPKVTSS